MDCNIPPLIELSDFDGMYQSYEDAVYKIFCDEFKNKTLLFRGKEIHHKTIPEYKGKSATFWHIISEGHEEYDRSPDLRRYERIAWPFYILSNCVDNCKDLLIWENNRKGQKRILIYCVNIDYLVVLSKNVNTIVFWTAYPISYPHYREKLLREYHEYMAKTARRDG